MPADPKRVQELFLKLAEIGAEDRPAVLDRECASDSELRERVAALLQAHGEADSYLDQPDGMVAATLDSGAGANELGPVHVSRATQTITTDDHGTSRPGPTKAIRQSRMRSPWRRGEPELGVHRQPRPSSPRRRFSSRRARSSTRRYDDRWTPPRTTSRPATPRGRATCWRTRS